jgi:dTDP-4-dehydrorhamnose 3,5-epimerase
VGSPTFGRWDAMVLDDRSRKSVYLSEGLAHGFLALQDNSTVMYLCSAEYSPQREHTISPTDPALAIDWPSGHDLLISDRDAAAPTLDEVRAAGLLPSWEQARAFVEGLRNS